MKKLIFGFLVILLLVGTVACTRENDGTSQYSMGLNDGGIVMTQAPPATYTTVPAPTIIIPNKGGASYGETAYDSSSTSTIDRMVIRTAYLMLVVDDVSAALQQIDTLAGAYGGFVVNSNISEDRNRLYAYISFRVDSARYNETLQALRNLAVDVKSESTSGQDVTEEYTDLASRLRNLEASEAQLLELMQQAGTVAEILAVQRELTNTRGGIELVKGQMQYLEQSSAMALFTVNLEQSKLVVEFTAETRNIKEDNAIQFYSIVSGGFSPYSYEWNFGDGDTSTEANPAHVYRSGGDFTVSLKVTDDKGTIETYERKDYITVLPGWSAGGVAEGAWNALIGFFRFLGSFFIGLGIFSPIWIAILVILYFAWWRRRKSKA